MSNLFTALKKIKSNQTPQLTKSSLLRTSNPEDWSNPEIDNKVHKDLTPVTSYNDIVESDKTEEE